MRFVLDIECDNAAFEDENAITEVARILKQTAFDVDLNYSTFPRISDANGNPVGWAGFIDGASYNELKGALVDLLREYEEGMECDAPDAVLKARRLLGRV